MFLVLSGKFTNKEINLIKNYFGKLDGKKPKHKKPSKDTESDIKLKMNANDQIYYASNFKVTDVEWYVLEAFENLVSRGSSSTIFQIIREKYGLGYAQRFFISNWFPNEAILSFVIYGFEKEKEIHLESAKEELFDYISKEDNLKDYYNKINYD